MAVILHICPFFFAVIVMMTSSSLRANIDPDFMDPKTSFMGFAQQERALVLKVLNPKKLKGNECILHMGCRDGSFSHKIATFVPKGSLIGLDVSYKEFPCSQGIPVSFVQGKIGDQGWKDQFDYIICTQSSEWEDQPEAVLNAIKEALKPGGTILILTCTRESLPAANPLSKWIKGLSSGDWANYLKVGRNISFAYFRHLLHNENFSYLSSQRLRFEARYEDDSLFKSELKNWFFYDLSKLSMDKEEEGFQHILHVLRNRGCFITEWENALRPHFFFQYTIEFSECTK